MFNVRHSIKVDGLGKNGVELKKVWTSFTGLEQQNESEVRQMTENMTG